MNTGINEADSGLYTLAFTRENCSVQRAMLMAADEFDADEDLRAELEGDYEIYERMTLDDLAEAVACRRGTNVFWRGAELAETYIEGARA